MKTNKNSFITILMIVLFTGSVFSQGKEYKANWELSISTGQSFIDYHEGFGTGYSKGLTLRPEITFDFSRYLSGSISLFFTTANAGDKNANYYKVFTTSSVWVSSFNHNETTLAPEIQFSPIKTNKHKLYIGIGPNFTYGNSLLSQSFNEASTTMSKNFSKFGYQGTLGYRLSLGRNLTIGGNYVYNKNVEKTEHLLVSLGYKIN